MRNLLIALFVVSSCSAVDDGGELGTGSNDDPVVKLAQTLVTNNDDCIDATTQGPRRLIFDDFASTNQSGNWPANDGYNAEFNGDWDPLNGRARVANPTWPGSDRNAPPLPVTTGFVKFVNVCPLPGATVSASVIADTTEVNDPISDATMVVYVFDGAGALISVNASYALRAGNRRLLAVRNVPVPINARRVALVPMVRLGPIERMTHYFDDLSLDVDPSYPVVGEIVDDFSTSESGQYGSNQPTGWGEWGGADFFTFEGKWATVWNGSWGGEALTRPPFEGGAFKTVALPAGTRAGDLLTGSVLSANTYKDPTSYSMFRITLGSRVAESNKLFGTAWANLELPRVVIPSGATSVVQELLVGLGPQETSSLYLDDLRVRVLRPQVLARAAKTYSPGANYDAVFELGSEADVVVPANVPIDTATYAGAATPWNLAAGNAGNHNVTITFTSSAVVTCRYRGGSSQAHPNNATQLALARQYVFQSCSNGAAVGARIAASRVSVRVDNGDSNPGATRVAVPLEWTFR